jgi:signal transduction histidine kinase
MHEFLALLVHELRNPVAPIRNASEIMQRMPKLPAPLVRVHQIIDRQLSHLTRLIDDLLDVARIVNGKIVLRTEPCATSNSCSPMSPGMAPARL